MVRRAAAMAGWQQTSLDISETVEGKRY